MDDITQKILGDLGIPKRVFEGDATYARDTLSADFAFREKQRLDAMRNRFEKNVLRPTIKKILVQPRLLTVGKRTKVWVLEPMGNLQITWDQIHDESVCTVEKVES